MAIDQIGALRNGSVATSAGRTGAAGAAGGDFASVLGAATGAAPKTAAQELEDYVNMTPAQRMRLDLLKKLGLTEEELANMSPGERSAVEAKLTELVQEQMREAAAKGTGTRIDTVA